MYQGETKPDITITVYHCCNDCKNRLVIPVGFKNDEELICLNNRKEVNKEGGLTSCPVFEE